MHHPNAPAPRRFAGACSRLRHLLALVAIAVGILATGARAQQGAPQLDEELQTIIQRYTALAQSVRAAGGLTANEEPLVRDLLQDAETYARLNPDNQPAWAIAIQCASMVKDDDKVFELFDALVSRNADDDQLRNAWVRYYTQQQKQDQLPAVYERLMELRPNDPEIRLEHALAMNAAGEYEQVIRIVEDGPFDPAAQPRAFLALSEAQFSLNRFDAALATLQSIPETALQQEPQLPQLYDQAMPVRESYVAAWEKEQRLREAEAEADDLPRAEIVTSKGTIRVELFEDQAPNTVANFVKLAKDGFFDGTTFHRVIPNFMVQGGCPNSREGAPGVAGTGNPGYRIPDEHTGEDVRWHFRGSLSMANNGRPDTGGSQFFITHKPTSWLNEKHTVFGRVLEGQSVVDEIRVDDVIETIRITRTRDHAYEPETIPVAGAPTTAPGDLRRLNLGDDEDGDEGSDETGGGDGSGGSGDGG